MHLDDDQVQRLLHGELAQPVVVALREHLAGCAPCRERVAAAERDENEVHALLRAVDHPVPRLDPEAVAARVRAHGLLAPRIRWAAGILLALGLAGVAYAAPGSPLRRWVRAVAERLGGGSSRPPAPAPPQTPDSGIAGIAVVPGRALVIRFTAPQTVGQAQVSLTDGAEVVVRAPIGAATFTSDVGQLVIDNRGSSGAGGGNFAIQIPRAAPRVEIWVAEQRVFLKEGARVIGPSVFPLSQTPGSPVAP
ncbi:MAG: anti-sigma factor family protein [Gemmatimonadales bacterium]